MQSSHLATKTLVVHDHDAHFRSLKFKPIILNDVPAHTKKERDALRDLIITTYDQADSLDTIPSCACGELSYGYNLGQFCNSCGTRVTSPVEQEIESTVWFRSPPGIRGLVNPLLWMILSNYFSGSNYNVIHWFCNPTMEDPPETNKKATGIMERFKRSGIPRGLNSFIDNFDNLIDVMASAVDGKARAELVPFLIKYRDRFFPQYLPMPSKIAFVLENTATGTLADTTMREAIDAAWTVASLDKETLGNTRTLERKMAGMINSLSSYYKEMLGDPFSKKEGWLRNTVFGIPRMPFSFRSVIVSESGVHDYEEIKIPYAQAVTVFKVHLLNKLHARGMSHREAWRYIETHTANADPIRDPLLEELLYELFREAPGGRGIWCLFIRYPTLEYMSIQALRVNGVTDNVSTLSVLCLVGCNAD